MILLLSLYTDDVRVTWSYLVSHMGNGGYGANHDIAGAKASALRNSWCAVKLLRSWILNISVAFLHDTSSDP